MATQIVISRIQHRRGRRENLPQPLKPGEVALTSDTKQVWIGGDPTEMTAGIVVYGDQDVAVAQNILDTMIVEVRFSLDFTTSMFDAVRNALTSSGVMTFVEADIIRDTTVRGNPPNTFDGFSIYVLADQGVNAANTIANINAAIAGTVAASPIFLESNYVGDLVLFGGEFDADGYLGLDTQGQAAAIATLVNRAYAPIPGVTAGLVTTNLNIEIGTGTSSTGGPGLAGGSTTRGATWVTSDVEIDPLVTNPVFNYIPYESEIQSVGITTIGGVGSCTVDIRVVDRGTGPGTALDSIVGTTVPEIVAGTSFFTTDLTGWTSIIPAGKELVCVLETSSVFTVIFLTIQISAVLDGALVATHSNLAGLLADDHTQYFNQARGDARYLQIARTTSPVTFTSIINTAVADYDLTLSDWDAIIRFTSATPQTLTIPLDATLDLPQMFAAHVRRMGAGSVTIQGEVGVTLNGNTVLVGVNSMATVYKVGPNEWDIVGDVEAP